MKVAYSSLEDFRTRTDWLRCTKSWNNAGPRQDCILLESAQRNPRIARLRLILRCRLMLTDAEFDLILIQPFKRSNWLPQTVFRGCRVFNTSETLQLVSPSEIIRGVCMCPVFDQTEDVEGQFYLMDSVGGGDMFLRLNGWSVPELLSC